VVAEVVEPAEPEVVEASATGPEAAMPVRVWTAVEVAGVAEEAEEAEAEAVVP